MMVIFNLIIPTLMRFVLAHSPRPCRMYFLETIGEMIECAWVPGKAIFPFKGSYQFDDLPKLRPRGKQKEKDYKYMVNYTRVTYIWNNW